jgi:tetratricopeptide (TPR) repeat protein
MRTWSALLIVAAAAAGVGVAQSKTRAAHGALRVEDDTYPLPPPDQVVWMSLGYRSAVADFIYAHVLVSYGLHFEEKRRFEYVARYLDTIATLDPKFAQTYLYADTLITLQPRPPRDSDYDEARELLLKGTRELPLDQRIWLTAGQFIGYLAPPRFADPAKRQQWQLEGARLLTEACELASDNRNIPYHCLAAATTLNRAGQREALIQMLSRTLAVNDDPEVRESALATLRAWVGEEAQEHASLQLAQFEATWRRRFGHSSIDAALTWGTPWDTDCLTRPELWRTAACSTNWADFQVRSRGATP